MEQYIHELLANGEAWRVDLFIDKMKNFKSQCTTNEQEAAINTLLFFAKKIKSKNNNPILFN
jgi:hypothetical protein